MRLLALIGLTCGAGAQAAAQVSPALDAGIAPIARVPSGEYAIATRALEGATKGASGARIVAAVRRLATDLGTARSALGPRTSAPELEAGVAALRAGASPEVLTGLRDARRPPLTMALAVLADLVASGVPADSASAVVLALAPTARDADLVEFRKAVERDISLGAPPGAAAAVRALNTGIRFGNSDATSGQPPNRPPSRP